jgi:hypothetical protein
MAKPTLPLASILRPTLARAARNGLLVTVIAATAYFALFRLPFWFPPRERLWSASYAFGFNNSVAILAMAGLLGGVTLLYLLGREPTNLPVAFMSEIPFRDHRSAVLAFAIVALCYAGLTFLMYVYNVHSAPWLMWETRHLLHRTWLMDVYGLHAYTEVAAEYGPILTYAPLSMYWLIKPLGASHEQAYFACHLLLNLAGLWCAFYVLSRATMPARARLVALSILAIAGFAPYMGINGVLLRYLFPFASLLLGHRAVMWTLSCRGRAGWWAGAAVAVLLLLTANILLSPEVGVAFALAWLGYAVLMVRFEVRILAVSLIALTAAALLCWLFLPAAYYGTLLRFSEGANNLPLLPAAHLLLYILTLFIVVPPLLVASVQGRAPTNGPSGAICGAVGILCVVMAPGALGRCDPPHVLLYGMGASMLLMIRLANISRRAFTAYAIAYAGVFIVLMQVVNLHVFYGISPQMLLSRHAVVEVAQKLRRATGTAHPDIAILSALDRYPRLGLPFASFGDPAVEKYVLSHGKLQPEYYVSVVGVYTPAALERKLRDVGKAEYLLVPRGLAARTSPNPCAGYLKSLREWFLYPANLPCRAEPLDPISSVNSFIADHYIPVERIGSWMVLRRISNISTPSYHQ